MSDDEIIFEVGYELAYQIDPHGDIEALFTPSCDYCGRCVDVTDDGSGHRVICAKCDRGED